jgi:hypothetical protein
MRNRSTRAAKAREFSQKARDEIYHRDAGECIFCAREYEMENITWFEKHILSVMHYVPRSKNGLGIPQNGALGCQYHHQLMDNGSRGKREEMLCIFREHLKSKYQNWNEEDLTWNKWRKG